MIAKHNALVDGYNALDVERQQLRDQIAELSHKPVQPELDFGQAREEQGAAVQTVASVAPTAPNGSLEEEAEPCEVGNLREQLADVETKLQRKTAQLQAKDNQITNLRERLSKAHDSLEGQRKSKVQTA